MRDSFSLLADSSRVFPLAEITVEEGLPRHRLHLQASRDEFGSADGTIIHASSEGACHVVGLRHILASARKLSMSWVVRQHCEDVGIEDCILHASWAGVMILADLYFLPP